MTLVFLPLYILYYCHYYIFHICFFFKVLHEHPCPPGPLGKHCREHHDAHAGGASAGGGGASGGGGGASGSNGNNANSANSSNSSDDNSGASGSSGSSSNSNYNTVGDDGANSSTDYLGTPAGTTTLLAFAAVAASVAIAAMYIAMRPNAKDKKHPLNGIIKKRVGLFSRIADRTNCATCRPEAVEDQVTTKGDYRLA